MASTVGNSENWQRVNLIGEICIKTSYLDVLHNRIGDLSYNGLPEDGYKLYQEMSAFQATHGKLLGKVICASQWKIICPGNGFSNSENWDITIIKLVIQYKCGLQEPIAGWNKDDHNLLDITIAANVCLAKAIRNELKHGTIAEMADKKRYNELLNRIERVLIGMKYKNMDVFKNLKNSSIVTYTPQTVKIMTNRLSDIETDKIPNMESEINNLKDVINKLNQQYDIDKKMLEEHDQKLDEHDQKLDKHDQKLDKHDQKLDEHDQKLDKHDQKLDEHDQKHDKHDQKLDKHDQKLDEHDQKHDKHDQKLDELDQKLDKHDQKHDKHDQNDVKHDRMFNEHQQQFDHHKQRLDEQKQTLNEQQQQSDEYKERSELSENRIQELEERVDEIDKLKDSSQTATKKASVDSNEDGPRDHDTLILQKIFNDSCYILTINRLLSKDEIKYVKIIGDKVMKREQFEVLDTEGGRTFFEVKHTLESGYSYSFKFVLNNGEEFESMRFKGLDNGDCENKRLTDSEVILITHNDGKSNNVHLKSMKEESQVEEVNLKRPTKLITGGARRCVAKNVGTFKTLALQYHEENVEHRRFPPTYKVSDDSLNKLVEDLQKLFPTSEDMTMIVGHNLMGQLKLYGYTDKECKEFGIVHQNTMDKEFGIVHQNTMDKHFRRDVLLVNEKDRFILNISLTESDSIHELNKDLSRCNGILNALFFLHEHSCLGKFLAICGILACPRLTKDSLKLKKFFRKEDMMLFLTSDDLQSPETLKKWWNKGILYQITSFRKSNNAKKDKIDCGSVFQAVKGETMATMSLVDTTLPCFSKNPGEKVQSLLLNTEQQRVLYDETSQIIMGPFGSGKSIVLKEIAKQLYLRDVPSNVYLVCMDLYSLMEVETKEYLDDLTGKFKSKVKLYNWRELIKKAPTLDHDDIGSVMEYLCSIEEHPTSFLFDEVDGEKLTGKRASKLKELVNRQNSKLHQIVLAPQSIKKYREVQQNDKTVLVMDGNKFDQCGLKISTLTKRMRMTGKLSDLIQVAEECVKKIETRFNIPEKKEEIKRNVEKKENQGRKNLDTSRPPKFAEPQKSNRKTQPRDSWNDKKKIPAQIEHIENSPKTPKDKVVEETDKPPTYTDVEKQPVEDKVEIKDSEERGVQARKVNKNEKIKKEETKTIAEDIDQYSDFFSNLKSSNAIHTKCEMPTGNIGHKVKGDVKPRIFYLNDGFSQNAKSGKVFSLILDEFCLTNNENLSVICSSRSEAVLACYALKQQDRDYYQYLNYLKHSERAPSFKEKENLVKKFQEGTDMVLVTDHRGFRGCEMEHVVAFINPNSDYKSHILVEIMARAISRIDILVLPSDKNRDTSKESQHTAKLSDVISAWENFKDKNGENIVDIIHVSISEEEAGRFVVVTKGSEDKEHKIDYKTDDEKKFKEFSTNEFKKLPSERMMRHVNQEYLSKIANGKEGKTISDTQIFKKHAWEDIDFLHPAMYGRVIGKRADNRKKLEKQFQVKLRYHKETNKMQISGMIQNKVNTVDHLRSQFEATSEYEQWETIFDSTWDNFPAIMEKIDKNQNSWQTKYVVKITVDPHKKEISIRGSKDNKIRFTLNVYKKMIENQQIGPREVFCIGLRDEDLLNIRKTSRYEDQFYISTEQRLLDKELYDMNAFKDAFLAALQKAKKNIEEFGESICYTMLHGGKVLSKRQPGRYTMKELFSVGTTLLPYQRLESEDLKIDAMNGYQQVLKIYRYDVVIFAPHPTIKLRYKLYLNGNHTKFISCEDAEDRKPSFANVTAGPGFFEYPDKKFTRLDIVDPRNGLTTRLSVSVCQEDAEYQRKVEIHLEKLRDVLENIKIKVGSFDISLPDMPPGYIVGFLRRSERKEYTISTYESTVVITSVEKVLIDYESSNNAEMTDIFFKDRDILYTLDSTDWQPEGIMEKYEIVLKRGHDCLQNLFQAQ